MPKINQTWINGIQFFFLIHSFLKREITKYIYNFTQIVLAKSLALPKLVHCLEMFLRWVIWPMGLLYAHYYVSYYVYVNII